MARTAAGAPASAARRISESGSCPNPQTFYLYRIEAAVLSGLKTELRHPEVMAEYVRTYRDERRRLAADAIRGRARIERRLGEIERALKRLVDAICDGSAVIQQLEPQFLALEKEQPELRAKLVEAPEALEVIGLHPATLKRYKGNSPNSRSLSPRASARATPRRRRPCAS